MEQSRITASENLASPRGQFLPAAAIVAVALAVCLPVLNGGFIWDDTPLVSDNAVIKASNGLGLIWFTRKMPEYLPLTFTMHWVEWRFWRGNPAGFHVVNALLHAAGAVLVWRVLRRLKVPGAWLAGMLFAVHPAAVASAAYISERKNTLSLALALLSVLAYLKYDESAGNSEIGKLGDSEIPQSPNLRVSVSPRFRVYILSLLLFLLALLAKTSVVMLPVVLLLCAWWRRGRVSGNDLLRTLPFFALSLALGLVTVWFQHQATGGVIVHPEGAASRLAAAGWVAWFYLFKLIVPAGLCGIYPRWHVAGTSLLEFLPLALLAAGVAVFWARRKSWGRGPLFAMGFFLIMLSPVLGFADMSFMRFSLVADHLQYAAMPGVLAFAAATLVRACPERSGRAAADGSRTLGPGVVAAAGCIMVLGAMTWRRAWVYADVDRFWWDNAAKNPAAWEAWETLGERALYAGDYDDAIQLYDAAIHAKPDLAQAYHLRAYARLQRGQYERAIRDCDTAIGLKPDCAETYNYRGVAHSHLNQYEAALRDWDEAIQRRPDFAEAYNNRGAARCHLQRYEDALRDYDKAIQFQPDYAAAYRNRAVAYYSIKEYDKAAADVEALEKLGGRADPDFLKELAQRRGRP